MHLYLTRALHLIGAILWIGGTISSLLVASYAASAGKNVATEVRRVLRTVATPAMLATWLGGLGMVIPLWSDTYSHQPWLHAKLVLVFLASGMSGAVSATLGRAEGSDVPAAKVRGFAIALLLVLLAVACLAVLQPGVRTFAPTPAG